MKRMCNHAGCKATATNNGRCNKHPKRARTQRKEHAKVNGKYVYDTSAWKFLRRKKLREQPLCEHCLARGFTVAGKDVDHIVEISDDQTRAYDYSNLQVLCRSCHMMKTAEEKRKRGGKQ